MTDDSHERSSKPARSKKGIAEKNMMADDGHVRWCLPLSAVPWKKG